MKRVLLVAPSSVAAGSQRVLVSLARHLPRLGIDVEAVLLQPGPLEGWLRDAGCPTRVIDAGRTRQLPRTLGVIRALAAEARTVDAVLSNESKGHVYGGAAARLAGVSALWWQHGTPSPSAIEWAAATVPAAAIICSSGTAASAQRRLTPRRRVEVIHPGIDVASIVARRGSGAAVRAAQGWNDDPVVGIVGRLQPWKGQEIFLRAAARVADAIPDAHFAVVGGAVLGREGDYPERLELLARGLGVLDRVVFTGHQDDVYPWFDALDVVVHASLGEPFGLVLVEAMALGKPLVATAAGGPLEIVEDDRSGLLVPPGDHDALADAVEKLLRDNDRAADLAAAAATRSLDFSDEAMTQRLVALLDDVSGGRRSPGLTGGSPSLPGQVSRPSSAVEPTASISPATAGDLLLIGDEWFGEAPGGLNRYIGDLHRALWHAGATPAVVVVGSPPPEPGLNGTSSPAESLLRRVIAVRRTARRLAGRVSVVDVHFALYGLLPLLTTRLRHSPLVVHFQGPWAAEGVVGRGQGRLVAAAKRAVERAVYRRADAVVVLSEAFGRLAGERYGVDPSRVHVIAPGVDLERFQPGDRTAARAALGLPEDPFIAVAARRLDARMGLDVLVQAWDEIQRSRPDARLVLAGDGAERERLAEAVASLHPPHSVRLLGRVSDEELVSLYQAADCSVVPSRALEGFGLVVLESLACGTPAIVSAVGGLPEAIAGLDDTLVVPPENPTALATRIKALADGEAPSPEACRSHAEGFSWQEVAQSHLDLYAGVQNPRPRVVYLDHTARPSGGELALARLLPALDGIDASVILGEDGPLAGRLRDAGIAVDVQPLAAVARDVRRDRVGRPPLAGLLETTRYTLQLARRLRRSRPDLVHTNSLKSALYGGVAGRLAGVPVVWHLRDRIADDYLPRSAVRLVRAAARILPSAVVADTATTMATLGRVGIRTAVVPSPIDPPRGEREAPLGAVTVGIVGRLAPWKGQDVFLRAFADAFPDGPERAVVVGGALFGEEAYETELHQLVHSLGLQQRVELTGFREDVDAEYARMDVLVHASTIAEPFGQVVVEGMAAGLAVVAADAGGPAEVVTDGVDGLLYPPADAEALAERLRGLAADPGLRTRLGEAGRQRAADFTPERAATGVMDLYRDVLRSPTRRARRLSRRVVKSGDRPSP